MNTVIHHERKHPEQLARRNSSHKFCRKSHKTVHGVTECILPMHCSAAQKRKPQRLHKQRPMLTQIETESTSSRGYPGRHTMQCKTQHTMTDKMEHPPRKNDLQPLHRQWRQWKKFGTVCKESQWKTGERQQRLGEEPEDGDGREVPGIGAPMAGDSEAQSGKCSQSDGREAAKRCSHGHQLLPPQKHCITSDRNVRNNTRNGDGQVKPERTQLEKITMNWIVSNHTAHRFNYLYAVVRTPGLRGVRPHSSRLLRQQANSMHAVRVGNRIPAQPPVDDCVAGMFTAAVHCLP